MQQLTLVNHDPATIEEPPYYMGNANLPLRISLYPCINCGTENDLSFLSFPTGLARLFVYVSGSLMLFR